MFKRKKKKTGSNVPPQVTVPPMPEMNITGIRQYETPEFRKPTPPSPPTSGSNAVKPNLNCGHQPTCTSTQNPPDTFSSLLKATSVQILQNGISTVTYVCPYELPCGWCTKWDKKCDKNIIDGDDSKPTRG